MLNNKSIALIPARSGSKRIKDKNIKEINGHPLIAYTIQSAIKSKIFDKIICATDSSLYAEIAKYYGAEVPILRDKEISDDKSSDFEWISWIINFFENKNEFFDYFSILRPTSPFRTERTIKRAFEHFRNTEGIDSLRGVELCKQHPGKMWIVNQQTMTPLLPISHLSQPMHSSQYASLPKVFVQNASIEFAFTSVLKKYQNISGYKITPFITEGYEGFDLNDELDWFNMLNLIQLNKVNIPTLPIISWYEINKL